MLSKMGKIRKSPWSSVSVRLVILWIVGLAAEMLVAQQSLESLYRMTGPAITDIFEPQRKAIQQCSAVIYSGRDEIAYGVVISADGYLLTKASEIEEVEELSVRIDKKSYDEVEVVAVDSIWDVALIRVQAEGLTPAEFAPDSKLEQGTWVVVNGATSRSNRRVLAGIISAQAREILPAGGAVLGVILADVKDQLEIKSVSEGSGAAAAGLKEGDVITALEGKAVSNIEELSEALKDKKAGIEVKVSLKRKGKKLDVQVELSARTEMFQQMDRNDMMSGDFSKRRSGFPRVIQHDILANSDTMGGPVLDLQGRVVGMNIARANRAETFAIPVEELRELAKQMVAKEAK